MFSFFLLLPSHYAGYQHAEYHALCKMPIRQTKREMNISIENYMLSHVLLSPLGEDEIPFPFIFALMSGSKIF